MMSFLSQTKTSELESASKILAIDKLTTSQQKTMEHAVGQGLWEQILEGRPMSASVISLIMDKMRHHNLLPVTI